MKLEQTLLSWAIVALVASFTGTAARSQNVTEAVDSAFNVTTDLSWTFEPENVTIQATTPPTTATTTPTSTTTTPTSATTIPSTTIPSTTNPATTTTATTTATAAATATTRPATLTLAPSVCTVLERRLIDTCLLGLTVRLQFSFLLLASAGTTACRPDLIRCHDVDRAARCLITLPKTLIRDACWVTLPQVMTENFNVRSIPCGYGDVARQCHNKHTPLLNTSQKKTTQNFSGHNKQSFLPALLSMMLMQQMK